MITGCKGYAVTITMDSGEELKKFVRQQHAPDAIAGPISEALSRSKITGGS